jgi:hypothetical protein
VRQLEELEAEEHLGAIRPYEEIGFEPGQIAVLATTLEEGDLACVVPHRMIDDAAELASMPRIPARNDWADLAAAELARQHVAGRAAEIPEDDLWALRPDILPERETELAAAMPFPQPISHPGPLPTVQPVEAIFIAPEEPVRAAVDLKALIAEWRRERAERDAAVGLDTGEGFPAGAAIGSPANEDRHVARATFGKKVA